MFNQAFAALYALEPAGLATPGEAKLRLAAYGSTLNVPQRGIAIRHSPKENGADICPRRILFLRRGYGSRGCRHRVSDQKLNRTPPDTVPPPSPPLRNRLPWMKPEKRRSWLWALRPRLYWMPLSNPVVTEDSDDTP